MIMNFLSPNIFLKQDNFFYYGKSFTVNGLSENLSTKVLPGYPGGNSFS